MKISLRHRKLISDITDEREGGGGAQEEVGQGGATSKEMVWFKMKKRKRK